MILIMYEKEIRMDKNKDNRMKAVYFRENIIKIIMFLCAMLSVITTFGIVYSLFSESLPFFKEGRLFALVRPGKIWDPRGEIYSIWPLLTGTLMIVLFSCLFAIPLGLGSAIYLSEYAVPKWRNILKPVLEILAGIPSVVYGFFAFLYVTPLLKNNITWLAKIFLVMVLIISPLIGAGFLKKMTNKGRLLIRIYDTIFGIMFIIIFFYLLVNFKQFWINTQKLEVETYNVISASFSVGIMITPLVASLSEDALKAVPNSLREAALGLGMTKFETVWNIIVPAAISGIMSSFILAISRAIGETMVVAMAAGAKPVLNLNPLGQIQTMTGYMVSKSFGEVPVGSLEYQTVFVIGLILFFITLGLNIFAKKIVNLLREVY